MFRWLVIVAGLGVAGYYGRLAAPSVLGWIEIASLAALIGLVHNLGLRASFGDVTFMPTAVLMAYMVMGREGGMVAAAAGLLVGCGAQVARHWRQPQQDRSRSAWARAARDLWPFGQNVLSLLAADLAFTTLGEPAPLARILSLQDMPPVLFSPIIYLIVYNLLLAADLWLAGLPVVRSYIQNRRVMMAIQLLPLALAPLASLALHGLGLWVFFIFEIILLTVVVVVFYLMQTQESLEVRVDQMHALSAMNRALRTSLERDALLETVFLQVANVLKIRNLRIMLRDDPTGPDNWVVALEVVDRKIKDAGSEARIDGLTAWAIQERQPLLADPVPETAFRLKVASLPPGRAWMCAPLVASGKTLGAMSVWLAEDEQPARSFSQADLDLLSAVAAQTGVALENAALYEAARQQASQLARLTQISAVMNASLNPEKVLEIITDALAEVAHCDKASVYLLQHDRSADPTLVMVFAKGFSTGHLARSKDIAVPLSEAERRTIMDEATAVWVPNVNATDTSVSPGALLLAKRENFAAYAYFPLRAQMKPVGMLAIYYDRPHYFQQNEIDLLNTLANQAALAMTNARIYHTVDLQLTQNMEQITRMSEINQRLSSTLEMSAIFNLIIDSAMEGCKADSGVLVLAGDPELGQTTGEMNMVAWRGFDPAHSMRMPHHVAEGVAREVLANGRTIMMSMDDPMSSSPRSQLCVPIVLDSKVIGALAVETERLNAFTDHDLSFASQLAVQAAVAIRNAQLYNHSQAVRDRLHAILDASKDGLLMLDPKGRIVMTNTRMGDFWTFARQNPTPRTAEQILADPLSGLGEGLGYGEGELTGMLGRYTRNPALAAHDDLYEVRAVTGGSRQRFVERATTPVRDESGNFIGLLLVFHDVTEEKELEEAREDLTRLIVHDLRSPLQSVMGSMKLINHLLPEKSREVQQATNVSERAVKKLLNLVNDLLDISSMESGKFTLHTGIETINAVFEDVAQAVVGLQQEDPQAVVKVEAAPDLPYVDIDRDMIERVVLNLVDNALKHTDPGTLVTLRSEVRKGDTRGEQDQVAALIIDNGPGVPDDYKDKIFDRFTQVPGASSMRRSTGLGLAFCRMAIESHGGKIWVEDNPGGGSIFQFTLPVADVPPDYEPPKRRSGGRSKARPDKKEKTDKSDEKAG